VGSQYAQARAELRALGLRVTSRHVRSRAPRDEVIDASPSPGTPVDAHSLVTLELSRGTQALPDVRDKSSSEAHAALEPTWSVREQTVRDDTHAAGTIVAQDPAAGTQWPVGSTVTISISSGPQKVSVPDLTGIDKPAVAARLQDAGLTEGTVSYQPSDTAPKDAVVDQNPKPHDKADKGSSVDVILSSGPAAIVVPDVTCPTTDLSVDQAVQQLQDMGLNPQVGAPLPTDDPTCDGKVVKQSPLGGNTAKPGWRVILRPGQLTAPPPTDTVPTVT
jgi:beta-lactam-binding protein with PASTA domain